MKTFSAKANDVEHAWRVVDAKGQIIGRLASVVATHLRGKHKPSFTPHVDTGDNIIVINAASARATGRKEADKLYYRHSGYVGNLKTITLGKMLREKPSRVIELAVRGMLPKGPLGRVMFRKLHVYAQAEHPHEAQKPTPLSI